MTKKNPKQKKTAKKGEGRKKAVSALKKSKVISKGLAKFSNFDTGVPGMGLAMKGASALAAHLGFSVPIGPESGSGSVVASPTGAPVAFSRDMNYHSFHNEQEIDGGLLVHTMEFVDNISAQSGGFSACLNDGDVNTSRYSVFPGNFDVFPALSVTSQNYSKWRLLALTLHFEHTGPTNQPGGLYLYYNPDVNDPSFSISSGGSGEKEYPADFETYNDWNGLTTTMGQLGSYGLNDESLVANSQSFAFGATYEDIHLAVDLAACGIDPVHLVNRPQLQYQVETGSGEHADAPLGDFMFNACGFFGIFSTAVLSQSGVPPGNGGSSGSPLPLGKVWVEAVVELRNLQIVTYTAPTVMFGHILNSGLPDDEKVLWVISLLRKHFDSKKAHGHSRALHPFRVELPPTSQSSVKMKVKRLKRDRALREERELTALVLQEKGKAEAEYVTVGDQINEAAMRRLLRDPGWKSGPGFVNSV